MSCEACDRIELIRRGANPHFIAELSESFAVLADEQAYEGWCVLLLKEHHEQPAALSIERQVLLWRDVARVAAAISHTVHPVRINYECLGNQLHHVHWHVIPRYANDPQPTMPIWVRPLEERRVILPAARRATLIENLRKAMNA
ncbi:MAG: HIT family protein [Tepidisphaeraceae bacterium]